jgi:putative endonuclease
MTNKNHNVLYTGVTSDLEIRVLQHAQGAGSKFAKRYGISKLVYFEEYDVPNDAIKREKQIKGGSRKKKVALINATNKDWKDLRNLC